jgi:hypothetical protein
VVLLVRPRRARVGSGAMLLGLVVMLGMPLLPLPLSSLTLLLPTAGTRGGLVCGGKTPCPCAPVRGRAPDDARALASFTYSLLVGYSVVVSDRASGEARSRKKDGRCVLAADGDRPNKSKAPPPTLSLHRQHHHSSVDAFHHFLLAGLARSFAFSLL